MPDLSGQPRWVARRPPAASGPQAGIGVLAAKAARPAALKSPVPGFRLTSNSC